LKVVEVEDIFKMDEMGEISLDDEFVLKIHRIAEKLRKRGFNIKKPVMESNEAS